MLRNVKSEYQEKYTRQLWDKSTRSNYFQLKDDRKSRQWRSMNHAPLHWDHEVDDEEMLQPTCDCSKADHFKRSKSTQTKCYCRKSPSPPSCPLPPDLRWRPRSAASVCISTTKHTKFDEPKMISSKLTPPPSVKSEWGSPIQYEQVQTGRSPSVPIIQSDEDEACMELARKACQAWMKATETKSKIRQKRFKERSSPTSVLADDNDSSDPRKRHKYKPSTPLKKSGDSRSSLSCPNRPRSAPPRVKKSAAAKPPFAMYGNPPGPGTRKTYNVKPKSKEIYQSALKAKNDRERLEYWRDSMEKCGKITKKKIKPSHESTLPLTNLPKDTTAWITEYQGNFKAWT